MGLLSGRPSRVDYVLLLIIKSTVRVNFFFLWNSRTERHADLSWVQRIRINVTPLDPRQLVTSEIKFQLQSGISRMAPVVISNERLVLWWFQKARRVARRYSMAGKYWMSPSPPKSLKSLTPVSGVLITVRCLMSSLFEFWSKIQTRTSYRHGATPHANTLSPSSGGRRLIWTSCKNEYALLHSTHTSQLPPISGRIPSLWWYYLSCSGVDIQALAGGE